MGNLQGFLQRKRTDFWPFWKVGLANLRLLIT
jgi:hypothetical protein